jgi:methylated-DNA-[protein]-cysteine S-methyltransferase
MRNGSEVSWTVLDTPIGPLTAVAGPAGLRQLHFGGEPPRIAAAARRPMPELARQLEAYFSGESRSFELELEMRGSPLQLRVWEQLLPIPYGETTTYGAIAGRVDEGAYPAGIEPYERPRLVGAAIGRNPIPVVVACHRVIGADGSLTGYRGGLERKRTLLALEGAAVGQPPATDPQLPLL